MGSCCLTVTMFLLGMIKKFWKYIMYILLYNTVKSQVEPSRSCCKEKGSQVPPLLQISPDSPALAPMDH